MLRFEVHPKLHGKSDPKEWFWHGRAGNGEITCTSENFTRHEDAVRAIRTHLVDIADQLGLTPDQWHVASRLLPYFDVTSYDQDALPIYEEKPLYPVNKVAGASTAAAEGGADHG